MKFYIPSHFSTATNTHEIEFLKKYPFATVLSTGNSNPEISKIPMLLKVDSDSLYLEGHFAKANPHWQTISENPDTTMIFDGAHGYVSPTCYSSPSTNVPTWNYSTLVVQTHCEIIEDNEWIVCALKDLVNSFEKDSSWMNTVEGGFFSNLSKGVVGIKAKVQSIQSKFKLSQNRSSVDQVRVADYFSTINRELADDMKKWGTT
jgi:transcriptional regulator